MCVLGVGGCVGNGWSVYSDFFFRLVCFSYVQVNLIIYIERAKMEETEKKYKGLCSIIFEGGI